MTQRRLCATTALAMALGITLASCSSDGTTSSSSNPVAVATTTPLGSVLSDITSCAGDTSATLMAPGQDPHDFSPSQEQMKTLLSAKLIITNGLGLEGGMQKALDNATKDGVHLLSIAPKADPIAFAEHAEHAEADHADHDDHAAAKSAGEESGHAESSTTANPVSASHDHQHGSQDPHFALDVSRMTKAATIMSAELATITGNHKYTECGSKISDELKKTDTEVRTILAAVPAARRVLVTDHEAFGYFTKAYNFRQAAVVIPGGSTDAEPSSAQIAAVAQAVKTNKVPAIFSNTAVSPKLVQTVAKEAGNNVTVVPLFVDSVGPEGSGAHTYRDMMLKNATDIATALK